MYGHLPAVRSRQPVESTNARASTFRSPSLPTSVSTKPSPLFRCGKRKSAAAVCAPQPRSISMYRWAYSQPESRSPKRSRPNPSWMHCFKIPPSRASRSTSSVFAPARRRPAPLQAPLGRRPRSRRHSAPSSVPPSVPVFCSLCFVGRSSWALPAPDLRTCSSDMPFPPR